MTVGLVLPLVSGVRIYLYPSPLHYRIVPELIYGVNATILLGTDTFLNGYARSAHAYDFRSLRYILAGAEPVKESTRRVYLEKFGLRILEGYGVTETAPALALNTPMFNKFGTVGRILPGMQPRLDKVEGVDEGGRLFVRGPNVMLGYLRTENPGVLEPPHDGWHDTGDIVMIDAQGFVTIKGRAKRFAKIAGEMISFAAVEALAGELWPDALSAVSSVPDARKGERLILVTQQKNATRSDFQAFARSRGATEIMVPAEIVYLEKMPLLGTGKVDNMALTRFVKERFAALAGGGRCCGIASLAAVGRPLLRFPSNKSSMEVVMPLSLTRRRLISGAAAFGAALACPAVIRAQDARAKIRIGLVPLISSGPVFIAEAKKMFERVNLDAELKYFADGALAMPALVAGELDLTASTLNAGVFNTVAKGAPFKLILDRGIEKPNGGSMTIVASNAMHAAGFTSVDKGAMLKGKKIAIQAPGSIDQYLLGRAAQKAGLDPRTRPGLVDRHGLSRHDQAHGCGPGRCRQHSCAARLSRRT